MINMVLIGGGEHSRGNHLPALCHYAEQHPGEIALTAFCDLNQAVVDETLRQYPFTKGYIDIRQMLDSEKIDACIAITPSVATAQVAQIIIERGIPLLMEKPPGRTLQEARDICRWVATHNARVMVSVNRRFEPPVQTALNWQGERPIRFIRGSMQRVARTEEHFFVGTALHCLDTMRFMAGDIADYTLRSFRVDDRLWYTVDLDFKNGARGALEVLPTCGCQAETYDIFGEGYRCFIRSGSFDAGTVETWEEGQHRLIHQTSSADPEWIRNGAYAETVEFIRSLQQNRPPRPSPEEILQSVELTHKIMQAAITD